MSSQISHSSIHLFVMRVALWLVICVLVTPWTPSFAQLSTHQPLELHYSPDGSKVAGAGYMLLHVWDAITGDVLIDFPEMDETYTLSISWSPDSKKLVSVSDDQVVRIWNISAPNLPLGELLTSFEPFNEGLDLVTSAGWSPSGEQIAIGGISDSYSLKVWKVSDYTLENQFRCGWIEKLVWHPQASAEQILIAGDLGGPSIVSSMMPLSGTITSAGGRNVKSGAFAWNSDGSQIAVGYEDGTVFVWNSATNAQIAQMSGTDEYRITSIAWSPDDTRLAAANGTVRVWNSVNGQLLDTSLGGSLGVDFSPDGTQLVYAAESGAIQFVPVPPLK